VRYEDLHRAPETTMREVLDACGLDVARYDFAAAEHLPVRGSSRVRDRDSEVHWHAVEKDASFRPDEHWRSWDAYQHARFARVAGDVQRAFGYDLEPAETTSAHDRWRGAVDSTTWQLRRLRRRVRPPGPR
jgi:hypothetical protein